MDAISVLIKDRDNRPYLGELYFHLGRIVEENDKDRALEYYNKSLAAQSQSTQQQGLSYEAIGNLFFDKAAFLVAGAYYDSVLNIATNKNSKRI